MSNQVFVCFSKFILVFVFLLEGTSLRLDASLLYKSVMHIYCFAAHLLMHSHQHKNIGSIVLICIHSISSGNFAIYIQVYEYNQNINVYLEM